LEGTLYSEKIWLYLHFPLLPLETLIAGQDADFCLQKPTAVVAQANNSYRIVCCNTGADSTGIEPNLALSTALALCPELVVLQQQPEQEKAALYQLALTAYNFSPVVIIDEPQGIWLELSGCDRLFKGYNNLLDKLHLALLSQSFTADVGIAFSADAARLLCQPGFPSHLPCSTQIAEQLQTLPLTEFATSEKQLRHFHQLGIHSFGDLLALPRASLGQRFGIELLRTLELLLAEKPCSLERFEPAETFHDVLQHPQGIISKEGLLFPMKTLVQRFQLYLHARQCRCRGLEWRFESLFGETCSMTVTLSNSENNGASILSLSRLQLERLLLPGSIEKISLFSDNFAESTLGSFDLFGDPLQANTTSTSSLIDKLNARLGAEALRQPMLSNNYLPEDASTLVAALNYSDLDVPSDALQPLWLLPKPIPIQMRQTQLFWREPLYILSGPRRLQGNWWQSEQQRDYYLACDKSGARYWLFKECASAHWFVHGLFS
tara:strand:- start:13061 stop:14536 length:1476 start_codon:yes stop_codon:yes gene_type:complete